MEKSISFRCGPYLLAPAWDSMTVVWESSEPCRAKASFAEGDGPFCPAFEVPAVPDAPLFQGKQMVLFRWTLENLAPKTSYRYRVELEGGDCLTAGFRTLPRDPGRLRLLTLSDSHAFAVRECFNRAVWENRPDFILHSGDLVEGTGAQAEQFAYFLRGRDGGDFIHWFPVLYAEGNHDQGGPYFDAYIYAVQDARYGAEVRGDVSMDCGGLHTILMNSNPWGLGEMNAETAGRPADARTLREIAAAKDWLRRDLAGERARRAVFRILVLHHPCSDACTARHIPAIAGPGRVDLLLAGHTHSYDRCVSADPSTGAGMVCITQQDARMYSSRGNYCVLDADLARGLLTVSSIGGKSGSREPVTAEVTRIASEKQRLAFDGVEIGPETVLCGDAVNIRARVTNRGRGLAAAVIPVEDNGVTRCLYQFRGETILLEPGESVLLEAPLPMEQTQGTHTLKIGDSEYAVEVLFRPACFACAPPEIQVGDGSAAGLSSSQVQVRARIRNIGSEAGTREVVLRINGQPVESRSLTLNAGESGEVLFARGFERAGAYEITVGESEPRTVQIEGGIQGMPIVRDRSGQGHDAVIHGAPRRGFDQQGRRTLILDGFHDYLEIADNEGLHSSGALTGMVWAKLPGAGTTRPGVAELTAPYTDGKGVIADHNPLLVKGGGLGWGTSYQFRMAVRDNGKVAYGVCFEDDNGEFCWNDSDDPRAGIRKDEWVQYTSAFDLETGGDSYENGFHSAHVDPPVFDAPVKNWTGAPLRAGLGFKNKMHNRRGRGTYHTMLPGEISQVRYYLRKLTDAENRRLLEDPEAEDVQALQVHLRFEDADLELRGTHITEWVPCDSGWTRLRWQAGIPEGTRISVWVQFSDDGQTVSGQISTDLRDGAHTLELEGDYACWVRLRTEFLSCMGEESSGVPVLREYLLETGENRVLGIPRRTYLWNTLDSWRRGTFSGAVGHQDSDVYRDHAEDL